MENYQIIKKIYSTNTEDRVVLLVEKDSKQYAMKRLNLEEDNQKQQVIFNEVKVLENLVHPNIIKYYETFQYEQKLCIVMEYAEGGDLKKRVTEKQHKKEFFDESQIWNMFSQICLAVKYLHDNKILHRDLKILNVFICNNGLIKLGDFGVSKQLENKDILTSTHVGTAYYLSPEQCNQHSYNHKVDIWMLGCLLYELCTLDKPFKSDNLLGLIKQITQNDPAPISDHYSATMVQLVQVMMQKEPEMRPDINQIISIQEIQSQFKKLKEQYPEVYKDYSFPNPKKYTGFLRIKQKPTLSFIPNDKKTLFVIGERIESGQSQPQSNEDELSNSIVSSDSSFQQQNQQQPNSASTSSPEKIQPKQLTQDTAQQTQKNYTLSSSQASKEAQSSKKQSIDGQLTNMNQPDTIKEQSRSVEPHIFQQNQYNQSTGTIINQIQFCQSQQDQINNNSFINQMQQNQKPFMTQEETFGMNKPMEDYVLQHPYHQQQQQTIQNMQSPQYQMPPYQNHPMNKNSIGNPIYRYVQQPIQQQQMNSFQYQQQHTPSYSSQNQYYDFFIGNATSSTQSENVSPINNNNNNHPILSQQMSLQHNHLSQSQFGYQSGYVASGTNSNNSSVVMDLRSPNTQNSIPQQIMSEMSSPINMPFSPLNQYEPMPNHYQQPYPSYSQNNNQIQQFTPSNQQPLKKQPMKIPRYKPPIVIDTTYGGNFSQKKSTPNSDIQGRESGLGSGRSGHSAQSSQQNSSLSSIMMMMMMDGENNNNQGQSTSMYGSSYNNSGSSNTTSNQSSTKNNSTKNQQCQNMSQQQQYSHNLPTTKVKPKYFNFPQSPNRTILVSDYLKQKLGEEKFLKMKSILDNSTNPQEILENNPQVIAIIGEENIELAKVFRYLINSQRTPSGSNHLRHKSFQGFENPFPNSDQINKIQNINISQSLLLSQNVQQQQQQQIQNPSHNQNVAI
ncbi:hypothetical protein ABPG74_010822 [Tetrahymena malaccensis]